MLDKFIQSVRYTLFPIKTIEEVIKHDIVLSQDMYNAIGLWSDMLADESPWLFDAESHAVSCGLPSSITSEIARLTTSEFKSAVTGSKRADFIQTVYNPVLKDLRQILEFGVALGSLIIKPYVSGNTIKYDYNHADEFFPVAVDSSGKMLAAAFIGEIKRNGKIYRRVEYHHMEEIGCVIENYAFKANDLTNERYTFGKPIELSEVPEWAHIPPVTVLNDVDRLLIGYFKMPLANTIDRKSPLGVSIYSRAVDNIKQCDRQFARILWEYEGSELAIHADDSLLRPVSADKVNLFGTHQRFSLPSGKERLYRQVAGTEDFFEVFAPGIRDNSLFNGLNQLLKRVEYQCSLAYGTLSDPQNVDKTAEEIKASKQRSYTTVCDIQAALQDTLTDLLYAVDFWTTKAYLAPQDTYEVTFDWGDSIIADRGKEFAQRMQLQTACRLRPEINIAWYFGTTEEQAKEMMADTNPGEI